MAHKTAPALLAACTLVIRASREAPCCAHLLAEIWEDIGLPPDVINVVPDDRDVPEELVKNPAVDKITFTGSTGAGRRIAAVAADHLAGVALQLGAKSLALGLDDYDVAALPKCRANPGLRPLPARLAAVRHASSYCRP